MLIAFEGPAGVGKTFAANKLSGNNAIPNAIEPVYKTAQELAETEKGIAQCFDRVNWISRLIDRATFPNEPAQFIETSVFAMPDTHLVFKIFKRGYEFSDSSSGTLSREDAIMLNDVYRLMANSILSLNELQNYSLFKSVTIMEVYTSPLGTKSSQRVIEYSSPLHPWWGTSRTKLVHDDLSLLDLLLVEDASR